jgi:hypothetical protein
MNAANSIVIQGCLPLEVGILTFNAIVLLGMQWTAYSEQITADSLQFTVDSLQQTAYSEQLRKL